MPNFYIVSDIHGFYNEFREALDKSGFDQNDKNNWLVSLGDETDRGPSPKKVIDYLMSLPQAIFIRGNHTDLMEELLERGYPKSYDYTNGTVESVFDISRDLKTIDGIYKKARRIVKPFFDKEIDYLELNNHILVHSFIPLKCNDNLPIYYTENREFEYDPDWRNADSQSWERARWGNPLDLSMKGLNKTGKTIICGHWNSSYGWSLEKNISEYGKDACFDPYYYKDELIMIDTCTCVSNRVNILKITDDFMEK